MQRGRGRTTIIEKLTRLLLGGAFIYLGPRSELVYLSLRLVPQFFKVISLRLKRLELIEEIMWEVENKLTET